MTHEMKYQKTDSATQALLLLLFYSMCLKDFLVRNSRPVIHGTLLVGMPLNLDHAIMEIRVIIHIMSYICAITFSLLFVMELLQLTP